jgi:phospholipid/cholesterol/gamma-HCH transport system substrate-binding protein
VTEVKTTVANANDLVAGLKEGRGTAGMLLRDEALADQVRQAVINVRSATSELENAAANAGALVSELQSKEFPQKVDDTLKEVKATASNFNAASIQVRQTITDLTGPDEDGATAAATYVSPCRTSTWRRRIWRMRPRPSSTISCSAVSSENGAITA